MGTLSLPAGIDLLTGETIPFVSEIHKSSDFVEFLKILDAKYLEGDTIRLILDNHSAHGSRETKQFFATLLEGRFVFMFTPAHASWLNLIESFFSRMTKQMLKESRVNSKEEFSKHIYLYFDEIKLPTQLSTIGHTKRMKSILMKLRKGVINFVSMEIRYPVSMNVFSQKRVTN